MRTSLSIAHSSDCHIILFFTFCSTHLYYLSMTTIWLSKTCRHSLNPDLLWDQNLWFFFFSQLRWTSLFFFSFFFFVRQILCRTCVTLMHSFCVSGISLHQAPMPKPYNLLWNDTKNTVYLVDKMMQIVQWSGISYYSCIEFLTRKSWLVVCLLDMFFFFTMRCVFCRDYSTYFVDNNYHLTMFTCSWIDCKLKRKKDL